MTLKEQIKHAEIKAIRAWDKSQNAAAAAKLHDNAQNRLKADMAARASHLADSIHTMLRAQL